MRTFTGLLILMVATEVYALGRNSGNEPRISSQLAVHANGIQKSLNQHFKGETYDRYVNHNNQSGPEVHSQKKAAKWVLSYLDTPGEPFVFTRSSNHPQIQEWNIQAEILWNELRRSRQNYLTESLKNNSEVGKRLSEFKWQILSALSTGIFVSQEPLHPLIRQMIIEIYVLHELDQSQLSININPLDSIVSSARNMYKAPEISKTKIVKNIRTLMSFDSFDSCESWGFWPKAIVMAFKVPGPAPMEDVVEQLVSQFPEKNRAAMRAKLLQTNDYTFALALKLALGNTVHLPNQDTHDLFRKVCARFEDRGPITPGEQYALALLFRRLVENGIRK